MSEGGRRVRALVPGPKTAPEALDPRGRTLYRQAQNGSGSDPARLARLWITMGGPDIYMP
jgi:hypothetical protein